MTADRRPWARATRPALMLSLLPMLGACTVHINMVPGPSVASPAPIARVEAPPAGAKAREAPERPSVPSRELAGAWLEHWPDRLGCKDTARIEVVGQQVAIKGSDCNNGGAYEITEEAFDGRFLRFRLRVPATKFDLLYKLELVEGGALEGEVSGSAQARVKWLKL